MFNPEDRSLPKNLCARPWTSITVSSGGNIRLCCGTSHNLGGPSDLGHITKIWSGSEMKQIREDFLVGKWPEPCISCRHREETLGVRSTRLHYHLNSRLSPAMITADYSNTTNPMSLSHIEVSFSNICNLKCRMCRSDFSSSWYHEDLALIERGFSARENKFFTPMAPYRTSPEVAEAFYENLRPHWANIRTVQMKGGEPFLEEENIKLLQRLVRDGWSKNIRVQFSTNGTILDPAHRELLSRFDSVCLSLSADGVGSAYEYIRGGKRHSFESVLRAVEFFDQLPNLKDKELCFTAQIYNIFQISEFMKKTDSFGWSRGFLILTSPSYLGIAALPKEICELALPGVRAALMDCRSETTKSRLADIVKVLSGNLKFEKKTIDLFMQFTYELDQIRQTNILESIPELRPLFDWYDRQSPVLPRDSI